MFLCACARLMCALHKCVLSSLGFPNRVAFLSCACARVHFLFPFREKNARTPHLSVLEHRPKYRFKTQNEKREGAHSRYPRFQTCMLTATPAPYTYWLFSHHTKRIYCEAALSAVCWLCCWGAELSGKCAENITKNLSAQYREHPACLR